MGMFIEGIVTQVESDRFRARCGSLTFVVYRDDWVDASAMFQLPRPTIVLPIPTHHTYDVITVGISIRARIQSAIDVNDNTLFGATIKNSDFLGVIDANI